MPQPSDIPTPAATPDTTPVIVIGEALTDIVVRPGEVSEHPGGSPMNVAIGLARLGDTVSLLTRVGDDARGDEIRRHVEDSGVAFFPGSFVAEPTSTAAAQLDASGAATYVFDINWSLDFAQELPAAALVHTGSIAAFLKPGADDVRRLLEAADASTIVTFDPNIRPTLLGTPDEARPVAEAIMRLSNIVKLSDEDAEWLYPGLEPKAVLDRILGFGPSLAIMTRGGKGALLASAAALVDQPGRTVVVADTIGAGDSFMSGAIHTVLRMLRGGVSPASIVDGSAFTVEAVTRVAQFAVDCAAITVSRSGANPPRLADLPDPS